MRYVTKSNASHKFIDTSLPLLMRGIQDHARGEIARTVSSSCLATGPAPDTGNKPFTFVKFKETLIVALERDPPGIDEGTFSLRDLYDNSGYDEARPDLAQTLRESIAARAQSGSGGPITSSK